ncbi:MAG: LysR family transcriptional regulator [Salinisphaera sp.]|jgi:DNA-binding transcriptional LysR family regulator|nr:LysR family transcriptional regulator [Salinisphaera sp.]
MKDNIDLNALRVFRQVVETESFTAAAQRGQRAVSSISRQIAALEKRLGQQLFYRHTRAVTLTEAGQRYFEQIAPLIDQLDAATEAVFSADQPASGLLTINAPVAFGERQVVRLVYSFRQRYPLVRTELRLTDAFVDPVRSGADVSFRVGQLDDSGLISRPLGPMNYVVAAAPAYLDHHGIPQTPSDLLSHDCLRYQGTYGRQHWYWRRHSDQAFEKLEVDGSLYSDDSLSLRAAALLGHGLILFPTWLIDRELEDGSLIRVLGEWHWEVVPDTRRIHLLYPGARLAPPKTAAFVSHVLDSIGSPPVWDRVLSAGMQ